MEKTPRFAIVDVGTNAVRFEIYELASPPTRLYQRREVLRLGDTLASNNRLNPSTIPNMLISFKEFQALCLEHSVVSCRAVGTSVFRQAIDAKQVAQRIFEESGISLEIISGQREAELIASGISGFENLVEAPYLFIDVGGGSTEVSGFFAEESIFSTSLQIGAISAQKQFLENHPPTPESISNLVDEVHSLLAEVPLGLLPANTQTAIGTSGTARALSLLANSSQFPLSWLIEFREQLSVMDLASIKSVAGMKEERSDIILAGAIILSEIVKVVGISDIQVSTYSLRHGLVLESIKEYLEENPL